MNNRKKYVLFSAQDFGYGPTGRMLSILAGVKNSLNHLGCDVVLIGSDSTQALIGKEINIYCDIFITASGYSRTLEADVSLFEELDKKYPDPVAVVSCYDYRLIVWGYLRNVSQRIVFDNLIDFWQIPEHRNDFNELVSKVKQAHREDFYSILEHTWQVAEAISPHVAICLMHAYATKCFLREKPKESRKAIEKWAGAYMQDYELVGAVCVKQSDLVPLEQRKSVLVTISGHNYPIITQTQEAVYIRAVFTLLQIYRENQFLSDMKWLVDIHPEAFNLLDQKTRYDLIRLYDFCFDASPSDVSRQSSESALCIMPPGNNRIFECMANEVPFLLLPERHSEQVMATKGFIGKQWGTLVGEKCPEYHLKGNEFADSQALYTYYDPLDKRLINEARAVSARLQFGQIKILQDILDDQKHMVATHLGRWDGIALVSDGITKAVLLAARDDKRSND